MRRLNAARRKLTRILLGIGLAITLLGSTIVTAAHAHAGGSEQPLSCAVCAVVHQPVEVGNAVGLPAPVLAHPIELQVTVPSIPPCRQPSYPRLSRAPPA